MKASEVLQSARDNITDPARWTQKTYFRDESGAPLGNRTGKDAACMCSLGAMRIANKTNSDYGLKGMNYLSDAVKKLANGPISIDVFNDSHTHDEVLAAFDKAIELAKAAEEVV